MGRERRIDAGGVFHLTARGNRRQPIFLEDQDYERFLELVGVISGRHGWRCQAFCLMPNHYHLLTDVPPGELSRSMHRLNNAYAHWFNHRHGFEGHVFQSRFHSVLVEATHHLIELTRYLPLNPVRAGLCGKPNDWTWSSFKAIAGLCKEPPFLTIDFLLAQFSSDRERARELFVEFVEEGARIARSRHVLVPGTEPWLR